MSHLHTTAAALIALGVTVSCAQSDPAAPGTVQTSAGAIVVEELATGLVHPWGLAFLPDGRLLVTEREGRLRILGRNNKLSTPFEGVPAVSGRGQGGLLDVALDPQFKTNRTIYLSFAEGSEDGTTSTALASAKLGNNRLEDTKVIFRQLPK
ncbi:MAG: PQQ-dependent sugar dehydrogenase, partial [Alphaproteobacteria bacterium]|nr:PQQ-dependent sugar dehydrogenase [Alphaproteobacteria bacterium]